MPVPTHTPTEQQLKDFRTYVNVQKRGRYNMLDPRARAATGLERDRYMFVIENYDWLQSYNTDESTQT